MKNKINNKGFTLIELLGVIVILVLILLVAVPNIASSFEKNKDKIKKQKEEIVLSATEIYANKYKKNFDYESFLKGNCGISISNLKEKELLTEDELLDSEGNVIFDDEVIVSYDSNNGKYIIGGSYVCPLLN